MNMDDYPKSIGQFQFNPPHFDQPELLERRVTNEKGGVKADGNKLKPALLLKSMPNAIRHVVKVLDDGAKKYAPDNWKKVEAHRYDDAVLRHLLDYLGGEKYDKLTGSPHLAHAICCLLFKLELESVGEANIPQYSQT